MREVQRGYIGGIIIFTILLVIFDARYLGVLLVLMLLFPAALKYLLHTDAHTMAVDVDMRNSYRMGKKDPVVLLFDRKRIPWVMGLVEVTVEWENCMLGESREETIQFYLKHNQERVPVKLGFSCCGEILIHNMQVTIYDIFGLCRLRTASFGKKRMMIHPEQLGIRVEYDRNVGGDIDEEWESLPQRGNDVSEVYDLREYRPGDSYKAIHWKISGKLDELIIREPGDAMHTEAVIILDLGRNDASGKPVERKLISATVAFTQICCRNLLDSGINYRLAYLANDHLETKLIQSQRNMTDTLYTWMGIKMPDKNGSALKFWNRDMRDKSYSHVIYITGGSFPEEVFQPDGQLRMSAVCISERSGQTVFDEHENVHMIDIPYEVLTTEANMILV